MSTSLALLRAVFALNCIYQLTTAAILSRSMHPVREIRETDDILSRIRRDGVQKRSIPSGMIYSRELACRVDMVGIEGEYYYTETGLGVVCGTYFLADPDEIVEVEITEFDASCEDSQLEFFDGWATSGGLFPSEMEHQLPMDQRVQAVCPRTNNRRFIFKATQNIGMISFKLAQIGNTLRITYKSKRIPNPCHVMAKEASGMFTLRNHGQEGNCSFANIYPTKITVVNMQIGSGTNEAQLKCDAENDFVQFLQGNVFDLPTMTSVESMCGRSGNPVPVSDNSVGSDLAPLDSSCSGGSLTIPLTCSVSLVRITSTGFTENSVHFMYNRIVGAKSGCQS
ncbi:corticotropin-releasing factor-binding protein-like isoform X3 [Amphiura filiformis]|uniref:corticotropin-releasing factor-binding protein-like isoform X3 n=1 Tax=Amphiura filiformis TaxID=82378 RepID=UPI003B219685